MDIPKDLQEYAEKLKDMYTFKDGHGTDQRCRVVDAKEFPNGIKAFILDIDSNIELLELIRQRCVKIVALLPGDEKLWSSKSTVYFSNKEKIPENWARCSHYSRLSHCYQVDDRQLEFHAFAADYYNFLSFVTVTRTNRSF